MRNPSLISSAILASALLAACGGGSGSATASAEPPQVEFVPLAASEGTVTFAGWLKQMSGESMENRDSMNTSTFTPTLQDDADPVTAPP
jgi:ABC-type glycerol-3-phosphate transport system substrate-binding protein